MKHLKEYIKHQNAWIFVVIKPGFLNKAQQIIEEFAKHGWSIQSTISKQLLLKEAHKLYKVHKAEKFYDDLCDYMSSGISMAIIFQKPGSISKQMFQETDSIKDRIRKLYGESEMRNCIHSSDSLSAMEWESAVYF